MRNTPSALLAHMRSTNPTLCSLISVTRTDGVVLAVTDHDRDVPYLSTVYEASLGVGASAMEITATLGVDNLETKGFLGVLGVSEASIASGVAGAP